MKAPLVSIRPSLAALCTLVLAAGARAQLSPQTFLPGDDSVQAAPGFQEHADIAAGGNQYLAVWKDGRNSLNGTVSSGGHIYAEDVFGARLDAAGNVIQTLAITTQPFRQQKPKVAWNGSHWLVVWMSRRTTQYSTTDGIYAARVSATGEVLDDPPILIDDSDDVDEYSPAVASDGNRWVVIWEDYDYSTSLGSAHAAVVDPAGFVLQKRQLVLATNGFEQPRSIDVEFCQDRFLMLSEHKGPTVWGVHGLFFDSSLNAIGAEFALGSGDRPKVASNGTDFYAAWGSGGTRGTPIRTNGTVVIPGGVVLSTDSEPTVAWDGLHWILTAESAQVGQQMLHGIHVGTSGAMLPGSPFLIVSQTESVLESVVAGGAGVPGSSITAWKDTRLEIWDLFMATLDGGGNVGSVGPLAKSAPAQTTPDLAGNAAAGYLCVYKSERAGMQRILAQRLSAFGVPIDPQPIQVVWSLSSPITSPRVAWNGSLWMVAWHLGGRIWAARVSAAGKLLDIGPINVMAGDLPDVGANGADFLVATSRLFSGDIRWMEGQRVRGSDGALLGGVIPLGGNFALSPRIESIGGRWLVTWGRQFNHDSPYSEVRATFVAPDGTATANFAVEAGPNSKGSAPSVAIIGQTATFAWTDGLDPRTRQMLFDGTLLGSAAGTLLSTAPNTQFGCSIGADGTGTFAAWTDYRIHSPLEAGLGDVYGCRIDGNGVPLDPASNLVVSADARRPEGAPSVAGDAGVLLVAYATLRTESPYSGWRIALRTLSESSVETYCTAKPNSLACVPTIAGIGTPSASLATGFQVNAAQVRNNRPGILLYSVTGRLAAPFQGGFLCVAPQIRRTPGVSAGGNPTPANDCSGVYSIDMNAFAKGSLGGNPLAALSSPGTVVDCQWWGRDQGFPAPNNTTLSNALEYTVGP